ncbi:hypothetical protein [Sphingobium sp. AntQ-1]|uniref:hypothetical protein n=1 Tax=Sphingobium sp. AntQ-1 TaxID=2930091 RepID=UPI00234EB6A5|nr:hypothetical protein [Sphingobium sp. AntQ-1]
MPRVILAVCLALGSIAFWSGLSRGQPVLGSLTIALLGGTFVARVINWLVGRFLIGPMRKVCYTSVAHRLRSRAIFHSVMDWHGWVQDTPGIAALVQRDQLFLCDHSTGYDELLLSSWQIAAAKVEREIVQRRIPLSRGRLRPATERGRFRSGLFGSRSRSASRVEENAFLEILYFRQHDKPVRSTRIPFGAAHEQAEGWMAALELSKRYVGSVQ